MTGGCHENAERLGWEEPRSEANMSARVHILIAAGEFPKGSLGDYNLIAVSSTAVLHPIISMPERELALDLIGRYGSHDGDLVPLSTLHSIVVNDKLARTQLNSLINKITTLILDDKIAAARLRLPPYQVMELAMPPSPLTRPSLLLSKIPTSPRDAILTEVGARLAREVDPG